RGHDAGHGEGGGVAAEPGHQSGDGDESHPVAGGGHGHGGHELRERWMPKEVSESGGLGSAEGGYLVRDRRHRAVSPPCSTTVPSSTTEAHELHLARPPACPRGTP